VLPVFSSEGKHLSCSELSHTCTVPFVEIRISKSCTAQKKKNKNKKKKEEEKKKKKKKT
jgi:hypothetical protein